MMSDAAFAAFRNVKIIADVAFTKDAHPHFSIRRL